MADRHALDLRGRVAQVLREVQGGGGVQCGQGVEPGSVGCLVLFLACCGGHHVASGVPAAAGRCTLSTKSVSSWATARLKPAWVSTACSSRVVSAPER